MGTMPEVNGARTSHSLGLVVTLALSCAHEPPLPPPPPAPVLADIAPVAAETDAGPEPMADAPALLSAICTPIWAVHEDGSRRIACTTHGPYSANTRFSGAEVGEHKGDPLAVCELVSLSRGSFTKAGAKEILLAFAECRDRGKSSPFVVVLDADEPPKYRVVGYQNDLATEHCEKTRRPDGRHVLYCQTERRVEHVGTGFTFAVVDFLHATHHIGVVATLARTEFDCAYFQTGGGNTMPKGYVWMRPPTFRTEDGKLLVDVERTYAPRSPTLDGQLGAECQRNVETDGLAALPAPRKDTIVIEPRFDSYAPNLPSKLLLDQWNRELTDYRLKVTTWPTVWNAMTKK